MKFAIPFHRCFSLNDAAMVDEVENDGSSASAQLGFRGRLRDGTKVAVKALSVELESLRGERGFVAEITALSNMKHRNLVSLRGCGIQGADRFLVYDYMENSSLAHALLGQEQNRKKLNWNMRRDISTEETLCCDLMVDNIYGVKVWDAYEEGKLVEVVDPVLGKDFSEEEASRFLKVGLLCVQEAARNRPRMSAAVKMLTNETLLGDVMISQPGHIVDLMDIHIEDRKSSQTTSNELNSPNSAL
ncbi:hypothetical protein SAY87_024046 [Trapa incisa]|uniref:Tyrosine-protein kinase catalytic domain-containing protein n=1 Tax=Trapa incisa TaxID=236973 RepID=A0AAN7KZW5_9MYRT|nr:hypothetical protein SAY87_024046 [Trapa incisa]